MKPKTNPIVIGVIVVAAVILVLVGSRLLSGGGDGSSNKEYKINLPTSEERSRNAPEGLGGSG